MAQGPEKKAQLTPKQAAFVRHYVAGGRMNATAAAKAAGYSAKTAQAIGAENLMKPLIMAALAKHSTPVIRRLEITADRVLQTLAAHAFVNMDDFLEVLPDGTARLDLNKTDRVHRSAIAELTYDTIEAGETRTITRTKIKLRDPHPALEKLMRYLKIGGGDEGGEVKTIRLVIEGAGPNRMAAFEAQAIESQARRIEKE